VWNLFSGIENAQYRFDPTVRKNGTRASIIWDDNSFTGFDGYEIRIKGDDTMSFPNYNQVIPYYKSPVFAGSAKVALDAFKTLSRLVDKKYKCVSVVAENNEMKISIGVVSEDTLFTQDHEIIIQGGYLAEHKAAKFAVNVNYMMDALKGYDKVLMYAENSLSPILFQDESGDKMAVVMPIRL
jgi:DNA polymerase III sliding clamp (beta) subunit (PCNA family)